VGFRDAGDDTAQRRFGEPFGRTASKDSIPQGAFAGDHEDCAVVFLERPQKEPGENGAGAVLVQAMQIKRGAQRLATAIDQAQTVRLNRFRRSRRAQGRR
jgi:hypothetical protein